METGRIEYEGRIYGIGEWQYSKVSKLLKSAFDTVDFDYLDDNTGAVRVAGVSPMFEEDEENLTATFDLLADQIIETGKGVILAKKWNMDGTLELAMYEFGHETFTKRDLIPGE